MLKKLFTFLSVGLWVILACSMSVFAVTNPSLERAYENTGVVAVVFILSITVIVAYTVMSIVKKKKAFKNEHIQ